MWKLPKFLASEGSGLDVDLHAWIDIVSIVGLVASTLGGVLLAGRLAQHQKLEDKVNQHEADIAGLQASLKWVEKLFKRE